MNIGDILEVKGSQVRTIRADDTLSELSRRLYEDRMGVMVVSDDGKTLSGIISERDIAYGLHKRRGDLHLTKVSTMMTKDVITCTKDTPVHEALQVMSENRIRHLVVIGKTKNIEGLISIRDVLETRFGRIKTRTANLKTAAAMH